MQTHHERTSYLPTLDGWRAIAVLAVVICHGAAFPFGQTGPWLSPGVFHWTRYGAHGVDVFFSISGFLIGSKLLAEQASNGKLNFRRFYLRRLFRIVPSYWVYLAVLWGATAIGWPLLNWQEAVSCLVYLRNYLPNTMGYSAGFTGHLWSLSVEEHFYIVMPPLLALLRGRKIGAAFAVLALTVAAWRFVEFRQQFVAGLMPIGNFLCRTDIRCDGLFWAVAVAAGCQQPRWREWFTTITSPTVAPLWFAAFAAIIILEPPLRHIWIAFLPALLIVSTVLHPSSWLSRCLEHPLLRYIGHRSYSIYLWQSLFLVGPEVARPLPLGWLQSFPLGLVLIWLASEASFRLIEKPMIRLGHLLTSDSTPGNSKPDTDGYKQVA